MPGLCGKCMVEAAMITQMRREEELNENCGSEGGEDEMDLRERVKRYQWQDLFKNEQVIMYLISCLNLDGKLFLLGILDSQVMVHTVSPIGIL